MGDYSKMTDDDFDRLLLEEMEKDSHGAILQIPGVYEVLSDHYNNAVLEAWELEQAQYEEEADEDEPSDRCTSPTGHKWSCTDDDSVGGEGRCLCIHCGADGDA